MPEKRTRWPGVYVRHRKGCPALHDRRCRCEPGYIARVWDPRRRRPAHSPTFRNPSEAVNWKQDTLSALKAGVVLAREGVYVKDAVDRFLLAIRDGSALNKKGRRYKHSAIRTIEGAMRLHVLPALGTQLLTDVRRGHVQALIDELVAEGLSGSRVRNVLNALRSLYMYAIARDLVETSPISSIRLPAMNERPRDRVATPTEFEALLAALEPPDALPFALAGYATARSQEIAGMRWSAVRWEGQLLRIAEDPAYAKSDAARRAFPLIPQLRGRLREEWLRQGRPPGDALVCPGRKPGGRNSGSLSVSALYARVDRAWRAANVNPIRLHEARHTASSWMRAAGIDLKVRSTLMGHATIASTDGGRGSITEDRYTHLLPGDIEAAGRALAIYLQAHSTAARSGMQG